jgi:glycerol-3-phosphate dehydrogenase (NAD(P)+)
VSDAGAGRVLLLGYGEIGHAMQGLLGERHELQIWNRSHVADLPPVSLDEAAAQAEFVLYCVPVTPLGELAARVLPHLPEHCVSIGVSKGLDEAGRTAPEILAQVYDGKRDFGVLYGPMIAEEIRAGRPAYAQVGGSCAPVYQRIAALFAGSHLALTRSDDLPGIAWAALLKNVYAILFGAADALQLGDNVRGYLAVMAQAEMAAIIQARGGQAETAQQLAGLGDLVTTATSASSHHHELGGQLVRGERGLRGEGTHTLEMVRRFGLIDERNHPLFALARQLVEHPAAAARSIQDFLRNPPLA